MEGYKMLLEDIRKGILEDRLTRLDIIDMISHANIDPLYKKGILWFLIKENETIEMSEILHKIDELENSCGHRRVAVFEKVSYEQYKDDLISHGVFAESEEELIEDSYESIKLPSRGTRGSAGYDFISPVDIVLHPGEKVVLCSGIRCMMKEEWVLKAYPRSSSGTKFRLQFNNTVPILDSDYYYSENEGHIMFTLFNDSRENKILKIAKGDKVCQGVFVEYGITFDDEVLAERTGGFGSTGK